MHPTQGSTHIVRFHRLKDFLRRRLDGLRSLFQNPGGRAISGIKGAEYIPIKSLPRVLKEYQKGIKMRNRCVELLEAIHTTLEDYLDSMGESQREKIMSIRDSIARLPLATLKSCKNDDSYLSVIQSPVDPSNSRLITEIRNWSNSLHEAVELLIRVHRYVSNVNFKVSARGGNLKNLESTPSEFDARRTLNLEMLAYEALLGETKVSSTPTNIQIEPTGRCNARCKPCPLHSPVGRIHPDIHPRTISKIPHVLSAAQFVELFALGEPTLAPSFEDIASLCHGQGCETHTITNGTRLLESAALKKMTKIGISYDGDTKEMFESIRIGIKFESLLEAIRIFRSENPDIFIYLNCTVNRANILHIPAISTRARDLGLQAVCFHRMFEVHPNIESTVLKSEDIPIYREQIEEAKKLLEGSGVLLFDYAILDRSEPTSDVLDPENSLRTIQSFVPQKESSPITIETMVEKLSKLYIPVHFDSPQLISSQPTERLTERVKVETNSITSTTLNYSPLREDVDEAQRSIEERVAELRERVKAVGPKGLKLPYCTAAWARLIVKADGRMLPCSCWGRTYANLNQISSFEETWNGEFHQKLRASFHGNGPLSERCKKCPSIDRYQGFTEILQIAKRMGISYDDLPKQEGCNPPPGKLQL